MTCAANSLLAGFMSVSIGPGCTVFTNILRLAKAEQLSCTEAAPCEFIPKSTLSNHLKLLRAAGLIETAQAGREMINTLRRDEFNQRFPGLLDVVLANQPG